MEHVEPRKMKKVLQLHIISRRDIYVYMVVGRSDLGEAKVFLFGWKTTSLETLREHLFGLLVGHTWRYQHRLPRFPVRRSCDLVLRRLLQ